jgi:hypothetical protein
VVLDRRSVEPNDMNVRIDTSISRARLASMSMKTKRTYNLSPEVVAHVRELAARGDLAPSQDAVVEMAIEQFYREVRDREEAATWSRAAHDEGFRQEMRALATELDGAAGWPAE